MLRRVRADAEKVDFEREDLDELVDFFHQKKYMWEFFSTSKISTNGVDAPWIPDSRGKTDESRRNYFENAPPILLEISKIYVSKFRDEGGRFWIDWHGAYSIRDGEYFVEWIRAHELTLYVSGLQNRLGPTTFREIIMSRLTEGVIR